MFAGRPSWILCLLVVAALVTPAARQAPSFEQLFERYRGDDAAAAIREFAKWPDARVESEARLPTASADDPRAITRLALFHTEAGLEQGTFGGGPADPYIVQHSVVTSGVHYRSAFALIERLDARADWRDDVQIARCIDDWFMVAHATDIPGPGITAFERHIKVKQFRTSATAQLLLGMLNVKWIGPATTGGPLEFHVEHVDGTGVRNSMTAGGEVFNRERVRDAELGFTRALELNPRFADARLRLGRLQHIVHRPKDAATNLELAWKDAREAGDRYLAYLAAIFAGQAAERAKRPADALVWYQRAVDAEPAGPVALLGAGHAQIALGKRTDGVATINRVFEAGGGHADPWLQFDNLYDSAPAERWTRLRAAVSATPFVARRPPPTDSTAVSAPVIGQIRAAADGFSVVLLIDTSGSTMRDDGRPIGEFASIVVDALRPTDSIAIVTVSDRITLHARNANQATARKVLMNISHRPTRDTVLYDAVLASRALVADTTGQPLIVLISDGRDNASFNVRARALEAVASRGIPIDAIELQHRLVLGRPESREDPTYGEITLRPFAQRSGGRWFLADSPRLAESVAEHFAELRRKKKPGTAVARQNQLRRLP